MVRTERESDSKRREEKWQTLWCCRDQQRACRMAQALAEKLEQTGSTEKERVASVQQREQLARTPEPPLPKEKQTERSVESARSWGGESQGGRESHLGESEGDQSESMKRKGWTPRARKGGSHGGQGGKAERASLEQVEGSMSG